MDKISITISDLRFYLTLLSEGLLVGVSTGVLIYSLLKSKTTSLLKRGDK